MPSQSPTRQLWQEVAQLLLHLLPAEAVIGVFQVVVRDEVGIACQLIAYWKTQDRYKTKPSHLQCITITFAKYNDHI